VVEIVVSVSEKENVVPVPHDKEAEQGVLGMLLNSTTAAEYLFSRLTGADFYVPSHGLAFDAMRYLHQAGRKLDYITIRDMLKSQGHEAFQASDLTTYQAEAPSTSHAPELAEIVGRLAVSRRAMALTTEAATELRKGHHPQGVIDSLVADLQQIDSPILERTPDDVSFQELLTQPTEQRQPWVVPGLLRQDWRCLVVGREGDGKSILLRQIGVAASLGVHPFTGEAVPPARTLIIDLENPQDEIRRWIERLTRVCNRVAGEGRLWHRPGGIDLRNRAERADLEGVLRIRRPNLVVLGPLYKAFQSRTTENDEQATSEVQHVLDDLRTRYGFALLLETHAPHGFKETRDLRPFGSSLWLRWPEIILKMQPLDWDQVPAKIVDLKRGKFRGDLSESAWPAGLHWGTSNQLPWQPDWRRNGEDVWTLPR
jgi:replicative DNA helicase